MQTKIKDDIHTPLLSVARHNNKLTVTLLRKPHVTYSGRLGMVLIDALEQWDMRYDGNYLVDNEHNVIYNVSEDGFVDKLLNDGVVTVYAYNERRC